MTRLPPRSDAAFIPVLLAALSHELGSPLAAIKGAATTLLDYRTHLPDDRIAGFLQSIDTQTDYLDGLLNDLIILAKVEVGTLYLRPEPIALRQLLEHIIADLPPAHRSGFLIEGEDIYVIADSLYLRKALALLLTHLCTSTQPIILRLEELPGVGQVLIAGSVGPDLADPLTRLDQVIRSTNSDRSRQAAALLRPALSQALIDCQSGHWTTEHNAQAVPDLCLTLPLATPEQLTEAV